MEPMTIAVFNKQNRSYVLTNDFRGEWRCKDEIAVILTHTYRYIDGVIYVQEVDENESHAYQVFHITNKVLVDTGTVVMVNGDLNLLFYQADRYYRSLSPGIRDSVKASIERLVERGIAG